MDVRCEKCQTEYELDESKLKPGGVTVKCTQCGHMFKIRMRGTGPASVPPDADRTRLARPATSSGVPRAPTSDFGSGPSAERIWIIRLDNGEQRTCRELGTLQQWILSSLVTRESLISRTGKTWKRLGDIAELASFFQVADEARFQRAGRESARITSPLAKGESGANAAAAKDDAKPPRKTLVGTAAAPVSDVAAPGPRATGAPGRATAPMSRPPATSDGPSPTMLGTAPGPTGERTAKASGPATAPMPTVKRPTSPPPMPSARPGATPMPARPHPSDGRDIPEVPSLPRVAAPAAAATAAARPGPSGAPPPIPAIPPGAHGPSGPSGSTGPSVGFAAVSERSTGAWASADVKPMTGGDADDAAGPRGPVGGAVRSVADEPAFAGSGRRIPAMAPTEDPFSPSIAVPNLVLGEETTPVIPPRRGVGTWVAIGSAVVIVVAAVVVYLTGFRSSGGASAGTEALDAGSGDGGAVVQSIADAGTDGLGEAVVAARGALLGDSVPALVAAIGTVSSDQSPAALATHARLATAAAQALEDEAAFTADKARAEQLRRDARQRLLEAIKPAQRAVATKEPPPDPLAFVAMADLLRQQGKPAADVRRHLDRALALSAGDREAQLVAALLAVRDGKTADARAQLEALDRGPGTLDESGDVRPRFRLAVLAQAAGDAASARAAAESVLAIAGEHAGARALLARLGASVTTSDPLPTEEPTPPSGQTGQGGTAPTPTPTPTPPSGDSGGGDSYDRVLAQANKAAEVDCGKAMPLFEKAIDLRPTGVEALSGAGYCHIDNKEFASAHAKFRAALAISRKFERALWGIAEAYQQQGRNDLAVEAYRRYLEVYPDSAPAKRQLDKLGGAAAPTPPTEPTPPPAAEPAPAPSEPAPPGE